MKKIALAISNSSKDSIPCDEILIKNLNKYGYEVSKELWTDETVKWDNYDAVILRSACDYYANIDSFLTWVDHVSKVSKLINNEKLVKNNYNKVYLKSLESKGIKIIPTQIVDNIDDLISVINKLHEHEFVIKGSLGTKSLRTYHFNKDQLLDVIKTVKSFAVSSKTPLLVQPYIKGIEKSGEISALYFNGKYSFAIKKAVIIEKTGFSHEGNEKTYLPSKDELDFCNKIIELIDEVPVYAKIDYVINEGKPLLVKVSLIEPNLYFHLAPKHVDDFIKALDAYLNY